MSRAVAFVLIILSIFFMVLVTAPAAAIHFLICLILARKKPFGYPVNVFIAYDQLLNTLLGPLLNKLFCEPVFEFGYPDETISSVIGKNISRAPAFTHPAMRIIDKWLSKADKNSDNHSIDSIENDEGNKNGL